MEQRAQRAHTLERNPVLLAWCRLPCQRLCCLVRGKRYVCVLLLPLLLFKITYTAFRWLCFDAFQSLPTAGWRGPNDFFFQYNIRFDPKATSYGTALYRCDEITLLKRCVVSLGCKLPNNGAQRAPSLPSYVEIDYMFEQFKLMVPCNRAHRRFGAFGAFEAIHWFRFHLKLQLGWLELNAHRFLCTGSWMSTHTHTQALWFNLFIFISKIVFVASWESLKRQHQMAQRRKIVSRIDLNLQIVGKSNGFSSLFGQTETRPKIYLFFVHHYTFNSSLAPQWHTAHTHTLAIVEKFTHERACSMAPALTISLIFN